MPHKESVSEMKRDDATTQANEQNQEQKSPETTTMMSDVLKKLDCLYLLDAFEERDVRTVLDLENVTMECTKIQETKFQSCMIRLFVSPRACGSR